MLDDLVREIDKLKSRINEHRPALHGNEAQTRMSLIDPLLRALGWETADPALVRPEYVVGGRRADYALLNNQGDVVVFLEAKNLGENLTNHRSQVVAYASELGIRFPALTNGKDWEVYDNSQLVPIDQRRVLNVSITDTDSAKSALQFLLLWRPNMASGQPIEANEPMIGVEPEDYSAIETTPDPAVATAPDAGWIALKDLQPEDGTVPLHFVRFPNGDQKQPGSWRGLLIEVAEWLIRDGALTAAKCPVLGGRGKGYCAINVEPRNLNGYNFPRHYTLSNGLYLYVNVTAKDSASMCRAIMEDIGKDPAAVEVQVG